MNVRLLIPLLLTATVLAGLFVRKISLGFRVVTCLILSSFLALIAWVGSLAPHRLAKEKMMSLGQSPSDDWIQGALATKDALQVTVIFWLLSLVVLAVLSIYLFRRKTEGHSK